RFSRDWSSDVCSSDLQVLAFGLEERAHLLAHSAVYPAGLPLLEELVVFAQRGEGAALAGVVLGILDPSLDLALVLRPGWFSRQRSEERRVGIECADGR